MLVEALITLGTTGLVAFFLWLVLHNQIKDVGRRVDDVNSRVDGVDKSVTDLTKEHNGLAREFSDLRGEIRGRLGNPEAVFCSWLANSNNRLVNRVVLPYGCWFDADSATRYEYRNESAYPDELEILWHTDGGSFILEKWRMWEQPSNPDLLQRDSISGKQAVRWLLIHNMDVPHELGPTMESLKL